jgi:hypothetical protein
MRRLRWVVILSILTVSVASSAAGQVTITPVINGNQLTAQIQLPGGINADLAITFEQVVGLNPSALTLTAWLVDPTDPTLLSRLPAGGLVSIPSAFPVQLRIDPASSSALTFSGVYKISLHTQILTFAPVLRLYRGPSGGPLQDMTGSLELGSVRAGGSGPGYSDFLILADARPVDSVIVAKFDALQELLTANAGSMPVPVFNDLQQQLTNARNLYANGSTAAAIDAVNGFTSTVKSQSGSAIPDVWQANGNVVNVAGLLRSAGDTLKFSLTVKANQLPPQ